MEKLSREELRNLSKEENMARLCQQMKECECEKKAPIFVDFENEIIIYECQFCNRIWYSELTEIQNEYEKN